VGGCLSLLWHPRSFARCLTHVGSEVDLALYTHSNVAMKRTVIRTLHSSTRSAACAGARMVAERKVVHVDDG